MEIKDVQMSSKGTIILDKSGIVSIIGDLAPKPATASGSEIRTVNAGVGFVKINTHCTGASFKPSNQNIDPNPKTPTLTYLHFKNSKI